MKKMLKLNNGVSVQMTLSLSLSTILLLMMCGGVRAWTGEIHGRVVCDVCGDSSIGPEDHALEGAEVVVLCITKSGEVLNYQAFTNSKGIYTVAETMPESDRWDACLARPISSFHEHCVHLGDGNSGVKFGYNHPSEKQAEEEENPNNHADLINTFCEIASASREEALFFLESHNFNLDATAFIHSRSSPPRLYSQFEGGMAAAQLYVAILLLLGFISTSQLQAVAVEPISHLKLNSKILQESIINLVNGNPRAGWKADMSPRFSNYTVGQFKHLLGVKPTPQHDLKNVPVITHSKTVKLPDQFDARTAWPQCSSIGKILSQGLFFSPPLLCETDDGQHSRDAPLRWCQATIRELNTQRFVFFSADGHPPTSLLRLFRRSFLLASILGGP
ncbi:hypothetical protein TEA_021266 [Camellia sinensis var. sinensis]|uniref:Peptidase C1A propeptide domain-containing protein n=1 Tax=Camellia sinensis var. sinensis TaxID=542762 RepID=A0A4V3WJH6_CAMSN|nr:hypothetical protein TEA_021266 [Camellia sinensis var. sinensis]